ncbi:uncharacterized protein BDZ83DRAFT_591415, partial [Colletotrichum acutatum]
ASSVTKISAYERLDTLSTPSPLHRLQSSKQKLEFFLLDGLLHQTPPSNPTPNQLPHKTGSAALPLAEGESRRPRQITEGSVCYRFRPP